MTINTRNDTLADRGPNRVDDSDNNDDDDGRGCTDPTVV